MTQQHPAVKLHPVRFSQLRTLAQSLDCSISSAVEALIDLGVASNMISNNLDGFSAERRLDHVFVTLDGHELPPLTVPAARGLASLIVAFSERTMAGPSATYALTDQDELTIRRAGRSFAFSASGKRIVVTKSIVVQIVAQLRSAAA